MKPRGRRTILAADLVCGRRDEQGPGCAWQAARLRAAAAGDQPLADGRRDAQENRAGRRAHLRAARACRPAARGAGRRARHPGREPGVHAPQQGARWKADIRSAEGIGVDRAALGRGAVRAQNPDRERARVHDLGTGEQAGAPDQAQGRRDVPRVPRRAARARVPHPRTGTDGSPTTATRRRHRLFIQAEHRRWPRWLQPTHAPRHQATPRGLAAWCGARDIIDWSMWSQSIFTRRKPLAGATLRRIEAGLRKLGGPTSEPFLVILRKHATVRGLDEPTPTLTTSGAHLAPCEPLLLGQQSGAAARRIADLTPTVATGCARSD